MAVSFRELVIEGAGNLASFQSSPNREKQFCAKCGSPLFVKRLNALEGTVLTLGTLDDDPRVKPSRNVFIGSKAPWHDPDSSLQAYVVYPGVDHE
jgi:hypothetical protein